MNPTNTDAIPNPPPDTFITVVSGLPRSGTSMMMRMLAAGGAPVFSDALRTADEDNPKGYFEFEGAKKLKTDKTWLPEAMGKAVKIISFLLREVPEDFPCKVVFLRRAMGEVLASQRQMLIRRGESTDETSDDRMAVLYEKHLRQVRTWLARQCHMEVLYVDFQSAIDAPRDTAGRVNAFLGGGLDAEAMATAVEPSLHRQREE